MNEAMYQELLELLRISSISSGPGDPDDLQRAAEWLIAKIESAGGSARVAETPGNPLVVGELAGPPGAPTVMIYGHYDVQSADPLGDWHSDPFEPEVRDGRLYGRGTSDDKGNFYPLLFVACELAIKKELPVNISIVIEGEEEVGGPNVVRYITEADITADCAIVFDSLMIDAQTPAMTLGVRGMVPAEIKVRTGERDLHSGLYGGAVLNAVHVLHGMLAGVMPGPDGRVPEALRKGATPPTEDELADWAALPPGPEVLAEVGGRPFSPEVAADYYARNWADASFDVTGIEGGTGTQRRSIVPFSAGCNIGIRLAPGQNGADIEAEMKRLLLQEVPEGAEVDIDFYGTADPALFDPSSHAIRLGREALDRATGMTTRLTRIGGTLPILAALAAKNIPTILSGFALAEDRIHAPNESFRLEAIELCEKAARELYPALARLGT